MYYENYDRLLINGKWPKVTKAADPSVILWQNMGISKYESNMRTLLISIVTLVLLIICAVINLFGANADKELAEIAPPAQCDSSVQFTVEEAQLDYNLEPALRNGQFYCFCQDYFFNVDQTGSIEFPDGEMHCYKWATSYAKA